MPLRAKAHSKTGELGDILETSPPLIKMSRKVEDFGCGGLQPAVLAAMEFRGVKIVHRAT
jgi:hypothetical protein